MVTAFSSLMASAREQDRLLALDVPADWMQGRTVFGGLQVALALRAMRRLVPDLPVRTLQATFFAPVLHGVARARAEVVRSGRSATHVEARLVDGDATLALVVGVFGAARSSAVAVLPTRSPIESPRSIELPFIPGVAPSFLQHFSVRWLRGQPPFTGYTGLDHVLELAMRDDGRASEEHVVALADVIPPLALSHLAAPAAGSTVTWMLELLSERRDLPLAGWRVDAQLLAARDGYTSQSVTLWGPGGVPVALSRQAMMVYG